MASEETYDVFLSHAAADTVAVEELARRLQAEALKPFLDKWHLVPGEPWQEGLEEALNRSRTFAVFLGPEGVGPWQNEEMRDALDARARDKRRRVIPVLLPGAAMPETALPPFLRRLTWVDFRGGLAEPEAFRRLVSGIKGRSPGGELAAPAASPGGPILIGVPHRNPSFTGRENLLTRLHRQLQTEEISALAQAAVHGLGGIGKTQTSIEYVYRFGGHFRFVLWVVADDESAIKTAYLSIARELRLIPALADLEMAVQAVKAWMASEDDWLMVFDNADDPAVLRPFLPPTRKGGRVLLTSRAQSFACVGIKKTLRVDTLESAEAVRFLIERTGDPDSQRAAELADELGHLPLALEQAAAYIETVGGGLRGYLARFRSQGVTVFAKGKPSTDYPKTVATTWTLSFDAVREVSPASAELLTAAAFLPPDSIPVEVFTLGGTEFGKPPRARESRWWRPRNLFPPRLPRPVVGRALGDALGDRDGLVLWELLEPLERYSLVERLPEGAFRMHRLTQQVIKSSLREEDRRDWTGQVIRALDAAFPAPPFEDRELCEKLAPAIEALFPDIYLPLANRLREFRLGQLGRWLGDKIQDPLVGPQYIAELGRHQILSPDQAVRLLMALHRKDASHLCKLLKRPPEERWPLQHSNQRSDPED